MRSAPLPSVKKWSPSSNHPTKLPVNGGDVTTGEPSIGIACTTFVPAGVPVTRSSSDAAKTSPRLATGNTSSEAPFGVQAERTPLAYAQTYDPSIEVPHFDFPGAAIAAMSD